MVAPCGGSGKRLRISLIGLGTNKLITGSQALTVAAKVLTASAKRSGFSAREMEISDLG